MLSITDVYHFPCDPQFCMSEKDCIWNTDHEMPWWRFWPFLNCSTTMLFSWPDAKQNPIQKQTQWLKDKLYFIYFKVAT